MTKNTSFWSKKFFTHCFSALVCSFAALSANLNAAVINVPADSSTIQGAINMAAASGDTIQIAAGTYIEEVQVVNKSLTIVGAGQDVTIIQSPDAFTHLTQNFTFTENFWCVVMIDNQAAPTAQTVDISDLTVSGSTQQDTIISPIYGNSDRFFAIGYHNASGTIQNVHTTSTRQTSNFNELAGAGIINASNTGTQTFDVTNCLVDFYQREGIDCRGAAVTCNVSNCTVNRGYVLTPNTTTAAPIGIEYSGGATGSITNNTVESNISTVANAASSGILPINGGANITVSGNILNNNDAGIAAITNGNNVVIDNNIINFTTTPGVNPPEGIIVQDTAGLTTLSSNIMNNIPINMDISSVTDQNFQLSNNQFNGGQTGLLITGNTTVGPIVTMNGDSFTGTAGNYIQEVTSAHDVWPSTATVYFDGLISGHITMAQYDQIQSKLIGAAQDGSLGVLLQFITPIPPTLTTIDPTFGPSTGGNTVTITGDSFISSDTEVFFGPTAATDVVVVSNTEITATAPPGINTVDVTVMTLFGTTPIVSADEYTYVFAPSGPQPPADFFGKIKKNKFLNKDEDFLKATWTASPSSDVVLYRIYRNGNIVDEIFTGEPLIFTACVSSKSAAAKYEIVAVDSTGVESTPVQIRIISG